MRGKDKHALAFLKRRYALIASHLRGRKKNAKARQIAAAKPIKIIFFAIFLFYHITYINQPLYLSVAQAVNRYIIEGCAIMRTPHCEESREAGRRSNHAFAYGYSAKRTLPPHPQDLNADFGSELGRSPG
jgi:hypothetical protein